MDDNFDFAAAMKKPKLGRPPRLTKDPDELQNLSINNIYMDRDINKYTTDNIHCSNIDNNISSLKGKLTNQELSFLEIYFNSKHLKGENRFTVDKAMISAGYGNFSQTTRYKLARKIVQKYEQTAPDARKVFSSLGYGPVRVALGVIHHAENSPPTVSLNALKLAAQCQGMIEQTTDPAAGITININTAPPPAGPGCGPGPAVVVGVTTAPGPGPGPAGPRKPLQITR
jgi:hypothetical protein